MAGTATVTGNIGAGVALSAVVFSDVNSFEFVSGEEKLVLNLGNGQVKYIDIDDETTITVTKSGKNFSVTVAA